MVYRTNIPILALPHQGMSGEATISPEGCTLSGPHLNNASALLSEKSSQFFSKTHDQRLVG